MVELISYTKHPDGLNLLEQIAYCARISNPSNQNNHETSKKLVNYLIKNRHWSPLEMVSACLEIHTTRDIARQMLRHKSFSFQEFSQRYADPTKMDFHLREARLQDDKNRQNSLEGVDELVQKEWENRQRKVIAAAISAYNWAIKNKIAKEQARVVLPEGNTSSVIYMNGTIRSWFHFCSLRRDNGTQKEHREIAIESAKVIDSILPGFYERVNEPTN